MKDACLIAMVVATYIVVALLAYTTFQSRPAPLPVKCQKVMT